MNGLLINILCVLMQTVVSSYFTITLIYLMSKVKVPNNKYLGVILLFLGLNIFSVLIENRFPFNFIVFFLFTTLYQLLILNIKKGKSMLVSFLFIISIALSEMFSVLLFIFVFKVDANQLLTSINYRFGVIGVLTIIMLIIATIMNIMTTYKAGLKKFFEELTFGQLSRFILVAFVCTAPQIIIFTIKKYDLPFSFLVITYLQTLFFALYTLYSTKHWIEKERIKNELLISELHNKTMVSMVDGVKILKHDYNNIMQALNGYVLTKEYDKLQEHLNEVIKECNNINNLSVITPELFNDPAIYGIVGAKYFLAVDSGITFDIDVTISCNDISFPKYDLSRILGILLDNAIEATRLTKNKYIRLEMKYDSKKNGDIIRIINTFEPSKELAETNIYEKGFSTKKKKSGLGLWQVKKIIDREKNSQIIHSIENDKFVQTIIIERN